MLAVTVAHGGAQRLPLHASCRRASSRSRTPAGSAGTIQAAQDISFQAMREKLQRVVDVIRKDPAVEHVIGFTGGGGGGGERTNTRAHVHQR